MKHFILVLLTGLTFNTSVLAQQWQSIGSGIQNTTGDATYVRTMLEFQGDLYVGGCFTSINGTPTNYIAKWDGTNWSNIGDGLWHTGNTGITHSAIYCMVEFNGELYVGGNFNRSGSDIVTGVAKWDGTKWKQVGTSLGAPNYIYALCVYNNELYVGGYFGGIFNSIAKLNGTIWQNLGNGIQDSTNGGLGLVRDMHVYNNELYIGGTFFKGNSISSENIIKYDGQNFISIGTGLSPSGGVKGVHQFGTYQNKLVVSGDFSSINNMPANNIVSFNSTSWSTLGNGLNQAGVSIAELNGKMVISGFFTSAGQVNVNLVAQWDGSSWSGLGSGINGYPLSLCIYNGQLYVAGQFAQAGGVTANHIAKLSFPTNSMDLENSIEQMDIFPNPSKGIVNIKVKNTRCRKGKLYIYNSLGIIIDFREIDLVDGLYSFNASLYPTGIYYCKIEVERKTYISAISLNH